MRKHKRSGTRSERRTYETEEVWEFNMAHLPLLTTEELSDFLKVPVRTLYAWRHKGSGPPGIKCGRHLRYRKRDVDAWLESQGDVGQVA